MLLVAGAVFTLSILIGQTVFAGYNGDFKDFTYFKGKNSANGTPSWLQFIDNGASGNYPAGTAFSPSVGYVMPNRQSTYAGRGGDTGQGGAVGTNALGYSGNDNATRKQKLYDLLERSNKGGADWEKMGSALIVHQMLGKKTPVTASQALGDDARNITAYNANLWNELHDRLVKNPNVTMTLVPNYPVVGERNTAGVLYYESGGQKVIDVVDFDITGKGDETGFEYAWVFKENGVTRYVLEVNCANPIGNFGGFSEYNPQRYSLAPNISSATANGSKVKRGTQVVIGNSVTNAGPNDSGSVIRQVTRLEYAPGTGPSGTVSPVAPSSAFSNPAPAARTAAANLPNQTFPVATTPGANITFTVPNGAAPGTKICYVNSVNKPTETSADSVWKHSALWCVEVAPPEYSLVPSVRIDGRDDGSVVEPGDLIDVTNTVTNETGDGENSKPTEWRLTRFVYTPGANLSVDAKKGSYSSSDPCTFFTSAGREPGAEGCKTIQEDKTKEFEPNRLTAFDPKYNESLPTNKPIGTKICFAVSVKPPTYTDDRWRHSSMWCVILGKKPKMQVWGGDVRSGNTINTSTSTLDGKAYGSWVEYGALSMYANSNFASGSALNGGGSTAGQSAWSRLTFANVSGKNGTVSCTFGCYNFSSTSPTVTGPFAVGPGAQNLSDTRNLNDLNGTYTAGSLTISASSISSGRSIVIVASGTVTIEGDIVYEDEAYSKPGEIPQVIIRAPTINIKNSAGRVDAWLLAVSSDNKGVLNTCSDHGTDGQLAEDRCNNRLTVNGPVVADTVYLRRTAGSGSNSETRGDPAEVFNLRADAYLWGSTYGSRQGKSQVQTVYTKELSPRF